MPRRTSRRGRVVVATGRPTREHNAGFTVKVMKRARIPIGWALMIKCQSPQVVKAIVAKAKKNVRRNVQRCWQNGRRTIKAEVVVVVEVEEVVVEEVVDVVEVEEVEVAVHVIAAALPVVGEVAVVIAAVEVVVVVDATDSSTRVPVFLFLLVMNQKILVLDQVAFLN